MFLLYFVVINCFDTIVPDIKKNFAHEEMGRVGEITGEIAFSCRK